MRNRRLINHYKYNKYITYYIFKTISVFKQ